MIHDRKAFALIDVPDNLDVVTPINAALDKARNDYVDVEEGLFKISICPVVIAENAEPADYAPVMERLQSLFITRAISQEWKPFLIISRQQNEARQWLLVIGLSISQNASISSSCCVLSLADERGFAVSEERIFTTVLLVSFMNVVNNIRGSIGQRISYRPAQNRQLYYTAQSAFIENPVVTRVFHRMLMILKLLSEQNNAQSETPIDMNFIRPLLMRLYAKMPREGDRISLLPLYSVMPGADIEGLQRRLGAFARKYYLNQFAEAKEKANFTSEITKGFVRSYAAAGNSLDSLPTLIDNKDRLRLISENSPKIAEIAPLPQYPGTGNYNVVYADCVNRLARKLLSFGTDILAEYFSSDEFKSLPQKHLRGRELLKNEEDMIQTIIQRRKMFDIDLPLDSDPDEQWLEQLKRSNVHVFWEDYITLMLADDDNRDSALTNLQEHLYESAKDLTGSTAAANYMRRISENCRDHNSNATRACIERIARALILPLHILTNAAGAKSYTYVWGDENNNLYSAFSRTRMSSVNWDIVQLPLPKADRFVLLRVSDHLTLSDIIPGETGGDLTDAVSAKESKGDISDW